MNRKLLSAALALFPVMLLVGLAGCGSNRGAAASPTGVSTTTGAVLCPEGYVTSIDGRNCVLPEPPREDDPNRLLVP